MLERLHFEPGVMRYKAMDASEHLSRYLCARNVCRGGRILDIACGEGYGAWLMRQWGARQVIGVDISHDAIHTANRLFGAPGIRFEQRDALALDSMPDFNDQFDVIVSFETMEHVDEPRRLLEVIRNLIAPQGVILISCPNGAIEERLGHNPYHKSRFSMSAFQELAQEVLGKASQWLLGVPHTGFAALPVDFPQLRNSSENAALLVQGSDLALLPHVLPAEAPCSIAPSGCSYFIGVWGNTDCRSIVIAPQSWECLHAPWQSIESKKEHIAMLESRVRQERRSAQIDGERIGQTVRQLREDLQHASARHAQAEQAWAAQHAQAEQAWAAQHAQAEQAWAAQLAHAEQTSAAQRAQAEQAWATERTQMAAAAQRAALDLQTVSSELQLIKRSRIYRLALRYYMLYRRPDLLGLLMRGARKIVSKLRRTWRA